MAVIGPANTPEEMAEVFVRETAKVIGTSWPSNDMVSFAEALSGQGGGTVRWFLDTAARDAYFSADPSRLKNGVSCGVGDPVTAFTYDGSAWVSGALAFRGPAGTNGVNGTDGVDGINGTNGATPYIDSNGIWVIAGSSTGIKAQGVPGETPYIGPGNHWFIGSVDTTVTATGATGPGVPLGGLQNQLLSKLSSNDLDCAWVDPPTGTGDGMTKQVITAAQLAQMQAGTLAMSDNVLYVVV